MCVMMIIWCAPDVVSCGTGVGGKTVCYTAHPYSADVGPPGRTHSFISFLNIFEP